MARLSRSDRNRAYRQITMLGAEPDVRGLLRIKAAERLMAWKGQLPCDVGLFSDAADQLDLVEMFMDPAEDD